MLAQWLAYAPDPFSGSLKVSADEVLAQYIYVFYAAFVVAFVFTPIMRVVASYWGIVDEPDRIRKMHNVPVAYLGGVAVFLGWLAGLAMSQFRQLPVQEPGLPLHVTIHFSIVAGASVIIILGLWDDIFGIKPWMKILGQALAAVFLLSEGIGAAALQPAFDVVNRWLVIQHNSGGWLSGGSLVQIPQWVSQSLSGVLVMLVVVGCCNATNLMDGLDGLCGGVTAVIAGGFLFLAVHLASTTGSMDPNTDSMRVVIAIALLGAVLGFVPYNFNPASIFMGDTGSMFLGFCCATMILLMSQGQHWRWFLASMVMFALPVLDTVLAFTRRWINGRPLFSADKLHFHHQLVARGFTVRQTVMISYGLAIFFAVSGGLIAVIRTRYAIAAYLLVFGYLVVAAYKMGMVHERPRVVTRPGPGDIPDAQATAGEIEPGSVLEVRDSGPASASSTASRESAA